MDKRSLFKLLLKYYSKFELGNVLVIAAQSICYNFLVISGQLSELVDLCGEFSERVHHVLVTTDTCYLCHAQMWFTLFL